MSCSKQTNKQTMANPTKTQSDAILMHAIELCGGNTANQKIFDENYKKAVKEAGFYYPAYVKFMKQTFEANPDNWEPVYDNEDFGPIIEIPMSICIKKSDTNKNILWLLEYSGVEETAVTCISTDDQDFFPEGLYLIMPTTHFNVRFNRI